MQLSGISDWISSLYDAAAGVAQWVGDAATSKINAWRADAAKFRGLINELEKTPGSSGASIAKRNELLARGQVISDRAAWIDSQLRTVMEWFGMADYRGVNGLGVVPLLVPAVIVAGIVAVTALIYKWSEEVSAYLKEERLVASGVPREQAQAQTDSGGLFGDASKVIWPLAIAAVALVVINKGRS